MVPVMALPSQFRSSTTCVRLPGPVPQSPLHVPLRGWPNCADAVVATVKRNATTVRTRNERTILGILSGLATRCSQLATCYFLLLISYLVADPAFASNDRFLEKNGSTLVSTRSYTLLVWSPSYSSYVCLTPKFVNISSSCLFDARRPSFVPTSIPMALYIFKCGMY